MIGVIVDANMLVAYFQEDVLQIAPATTGPVTPLMAALDLEFTACLDEDHHIEHEWRERLDQEWLDSWLASALRDGRIRPVVAKRDQQLERAIRDAGFPHRSRDIWYVRTARGANSVFSEVILLSEDLDFYDPRRKGVATGQQRFELLRQRRGRVLGVLATKRIEVHCAATAMARICSD